ncbi:MAG: hypothetical protein NTX49_09130 [Chlamydiae bacterium]|nr:hypothetical protein [Chlamydiota bacterium]
MNQISLSNPSYQNISLIISDRFAQLKASFPSCEKIQKIALKTIAALALAVGVAAIVTVAVGVIAFPMGLGLVLGSLAAMGSSYLLYRNVIDYSDPETINSLRIVSASAGWSTLVFTHGLPNLLKYQIIDPIKCSQIFQEKLNTLNFLEASALFDLLVQSIKTHSPEKERYLAAVIKRDLIDWNLKWKDEVRDLSACEIADCYNIELLRDSHVFDVSELYFLQETSQRLQEARSAYQRQSDGVTQDFLAQIRPQQEDLEGEIAAADALYLAILPQRIPIIQREYERDSAAIVAEQNRVKAFINGRIEQIQVLLRLPQTAPDAEALQSELEVKRNEVIEVDRIALAITQQSWTAFNRQRQVFAEEIAAASLERNAHYERASAEFTRQRAEATCQRDQRLMAIKEVFDAIRKGLNDEYQRSFRL